MTSARKTGHPGPRGPLFLRWGALAIIIVALASAWRPLAAWMAPGTLSVTEVRGVWTLDPEAMRRRWGGDFGITDQDLEHLQQRLAGLRIDLSGPEAVVTVAGTTVTHAWHSTPDQGKAPAVTVSWKQPVPVLGTGTSFTRIDGHLAIASEGALLLVRRAP